MPWSSFCMFHACYTCRQQASSLLRWEIATLQSLSHCCCCKMLSPDRPRQTLETPRPRSLFCLAGQKPAPGSRHGPGCFLLSSALILFGLPLAVQTSRVSVLASLSADGSPHTANVDLARRSCCHRLAVCLCLLGPLPWHTRLQVVCKLKNATGCLAFEHAGGERLHAGHAG